MNPSAANRPHSVPNKVLKPGIETWHAKCLPVNGKQELKDINAFFSFPFKDSNSIISLNLSILVFIQHTQVSLLQGDAVDHDEVL